MSEPKQSWPPRVAVIISSNGALARVLDKPFEMKEPHAGTYISIQEHEALVAKGRADAFTQAARHVMPRSAIVAGEFLAMSLKEERKLKGK